MSPDPHQHMILIKGEVKTQSVREIKNNPDTGGYDVTFSGGKTYSYAKSNIVILKNPVTISPSENRLYRNGEALNNVKGIYVFEHESGKYYHVFFNNESVGGYSEKDITIKSAIRVGHGGDPKDVFSYLKELSAVSNLADENGERILERWYGKIDSVEKDTMLYSYLHPDKSLRIKRAAGTPIFPFGCNRSQKEAVYRALTSPLSIIQGPPGTGKTQTILNILANLVLRHQTVVVVSNNNTALENIRQKLSDPKYELDFIAAFLGRQENKEEFINNQSGKYPDFGSWNKEGLSTTPEDIQLMSESLDSYYDLKERMAKLKEELSAVQTEKKHFEVIAKDIRIEDIEVDRKLDTSEKVLQKYLKMLWYAEDPGRLGLFERIKRWFLRVFMKIDPEPSIRDFHEMLLRFYSLRIQELEQEIEDTDKIIEAMGTVSPEVLSFMSLIYFREKVKKRYKGGERVVFEADDLWKKPGAFAEEYPVILSTNFSAIKSLGTGSGSYMYDYLIMDEASQADVATGALALLCAKAAVIVGDEKQLPNVVTGEDAARADEIFGRFSVSEAYRYKNSFLKSVMELFPGAPKTLLREHYRCHPKIIGFCNRKFYNGELIVMTEDYGERDVLMVNQTAPGNHARGHKNLRQVEVIRDEVMPSVNAAKEEIGIIAPYRDQVALLKETFAEIECDTVHAFQGREKDTIIISTVDNTPTDFSDDPHLINVAVSRAKKQLITVTPSLDERQDRNIVDLIDYIYYQKGEVRSSKIHSVFDCLYEQNRVQREAFLKDVKAVSQYDSENLMYAVISGVLEDYPTLGTAIHCPLHQIIKDTNALTGSERSYVMHPAAHVDFLIYNKLGNTPILAIEVDGWTFHKEGTVQSERDAMKDAIFKRSGLPLLRLETTGSGEEYKIRNMLESIYNCEESAIIG